MEKSEWWNGMYASVYDSGSRRADIYEVVGMTEKHYVGAAIGEDSDSAPLRRDDCCLVHLPIKAFAEDEALLFTNFDAARAFA